MSKEHLVKSFDDALNGVEADLVQMGQMTMAQLDQIIDALNNGEVRQIYEAIIVDSRIDELDERVAATVPSVIALRQPLAEDVRTLISYDRMSTELERIGDHLKNIARRLLPVLNSKQEVSISGIANLAEMVKPLLEEMLRALVEGDAETAEAIIASDVLLDEEYEKVIAGLSEEICQAHDPSGSNLQLLFVAKSLERVGDHIGNVCEDVVYQVRGQRPKIPASRS